MKHKDLGRAKYSAIRSGGVVRLIATGTKPNLQAKPDFEELPFLIHPRMFGFFFISPHIVNPMLVPFTYEESFPYPIDVGVVRVQDAEGFHEIEITDVSPPPPTTAIPGPTDSGYCVFNMIGTEKHMIAKCDSIILMIYRRVHGPDTYAGCQNYIGTHGGPGF
jgi:hypothetical protein